MLIHISTKMGPRRVPRDYVQCPEYRLQLEVIDTRKEAFLYGRDSDDQSMIFFANRSETISEDDGIYFKLLPPDQGTNTSTWNIDLFCNIAEKYMREHLHQEPNGFTLINMLHWNAFNPVDQYMPEDMQAMLPGYEELGLKKAELDQDLTSHLQGLRKGV